MRTGAERRRGGARRFGRSRHEDTVGHAGVEVHVMVERRTEAVQEGDGAQPRITTAASMATRVQRTSAGG